MGEPLGPRAIGSDWRQDLRDDTLERAIDRLARDREEPRRMPESRASRVGSLAGFSSCRVFYAPALVAPFLADADGGRVCTGDVGDDRPRCVSPCGQIDTHTRAKVYSGKSFPLCWIAIDGVDECRRR